MKDTLVKKPRRTGDEALRTSRCEQILEAAAKLFAEHGYADGDTQLLAEKLGVGKGTIYRYFPSKRELFLAAADRVMRMLRERLSPVQVDSAAEVGWSPDALEAQAFAYLAVRSLKGLPITFPSTTGVPRPLTGGILVRN